MKFLTRFLTFLMVMSGSALAFAQEAMMSKADGGFNLGSLFIPAIVVVCVLTVLLVLALFLRNYIVVPPNTAAIISGRKHKITNLDGTVEWVGFRIVKGGATFKLPLIEKVKYLNLNIFTMQVTTKGAVTKEGVPVSVEAVANVKVGGDDVCLRNAAESILDMNHDEVESTARKTLEAHLRTVCSTLTVEEINNNRQAFSQKISSESAEELKRLGLVITGMPVQHMTDDLGYIDSLGKKRTAEVKKDAAIGEAEAKRDQEIKTAEAKKESAQKGSTADREGEVAKNENLAQIAAAERDMKKKKADYDAEIAIQEAKRDQAGPKAKAEAEQGVLVAQVAAQQAKVEAETEFQKKLAVKNEEELKATVIKQAEAAKNKVQIDAEAAQKKVEIDAEAARKKAEIDAKAAVARAEGEKNAAIAKAEGAQKALAAEGAGEGEKAKAIGVGEAAAIQAKLMAEAEGQAAMKQKMLEAEAAGQKAMLLAEGEGQLRLAEALKAKLLAEAEGKAKMAEALKAMDEGARFMLLLQAAPPVIEAIGDAAAKALTPAFQSIGAGLANIDKVTIVDTGSGSEGGGGVARFAKQAPTLFYEVMQTAKALGVDPSALFDKIGVKVLESGTLGVEDKGTTTGPAV